MTEKSDLLKLRCQLLRRTALSLVNEMKLWTTGGMTPTGENRSYLDKNAQAPHSLPQIPQALVWDQTRAHSLTGRRLTT